MNNTVKIIQLINEWLASLSSKEKELERKVTFAFKQFSWKILYFTPKLSLGPRFSMFIINGYFKKSKNACSPWTPCEQSINKYILLIKYNFLNLLYN